MKKTYRKPESEINIVDIEQLMDIKVSGEVQGGNGEGNDPLPGGGGNEPPADINKSSLWDEEEYI